MRTSHSKDVRTRYGRVFKNTTTRASERSNARLRATRLVSLEARHLSACSNSAVPTGVFTPPPHIGPASVREKRLCAASEREAGSRAYVYTTFSGGPLEGNDTTLRKSYVTAGPDDTHGRLLHTRRRARLRHRIGLGLTPRRTGALAAPLQCSASLLARADRGTHRQCSTQCLRPTRSRPRRQRTTPRRRAPRASSSPSPRCVPRSVRSPQQAALTVFRAASKLFWRSWCRKWVRSIPFAVERVCPRAVLNDGRAL